MPYTIYRNISAKFATKGLLLGRQRWINLMKKQASKRFTGQDLDIEFDRLVASGVLEEVGLDD